MAKLKIPGDRLFTKWRARDEELLLRAIKEGASLAVTCAALHRTPNSIKQHIQQWTIRDLQGDRNVPVALRSFPKRWLEDFHAVTDRMDRATYPKRVLTLVMRANRRRALGRGR